VSLVTRSNKTLVADNVRAYLAADATLAAFFGTDRIRVREYQEQGGPTPAPYLVVEHGRLDDKPTTSQAANARYDVELIAYLPRYVTADASLSTPSTPTAAAGTFGILSVSRRYAVTFYTATGESYASDLSTVVTVTSKRIAVTIPTGPAGTVGRRIWATRSSGLCPRFLDVIPDNTTTTYSDETLDIHLGDEIPPYPGDYGDIFEHAKSVLWANRQLFQLVPTATGAQLTDSIALFRDSKPAIDATRNQLVYSTTATYSLHYSMSDRGSLIEV